MDDTPTCGKGLAANAPLPERLGRVAAAMAVVLESHLPMLDRSDPLAVEEHAVYVELVAGHRRAAEVLRDVAQRMAHARDLLMGRHVDSPEANTTMGRAFAEFVESEADLHALLVARLKQDRQMLAAELPKER